MTSTKSIPTAHNTRVLAFDPGFERLGVAIVEKQSGKEILLYSDCIRTSKSLSFHERLYIVGATAVKLIEEYKPTAVALEEVYFSKNEKTAMKIAEVRGVLAYVARANHLPVYEYTPQEVKIAVTGYGKSDKTAVALMVPKLVQVSKQKRLDDELDAIAVGLTCLASVRNSLS